LQCVEPFDHPTIWLYKGSEMIITVVVERSYFTFPWSIQG